MRVAVIGLGSIGTRHVNNLRHLGCDVDAYDTDPATGVPHPDGAWAVRYDAVVIATPYETHLDYVRQCLAGHTAFFVEKPLGSIEQLPAWRAICESWGDETPIHQVGYQCRFVPEAQTIKAIASKRVVSTQCFVDMRTWPGTYGDPLLECSHDLDLALWWGAPPVVSRLADQSALERPEGPGDWFYLGESDAPVHGSCWFRYAADRVNREWSCDGDPYGYQTAFWDARPVPEQAYADEMDHFLKQVRCEFLTSDPAAYLADGIAVLDVCRQVQEAACRSSV